jgi:hypothetical protein
MTRRLRRRLPWVLLVLTLFSAGLHPQPPFTVTVSAPPELADMAARVKAIEPASLAASLVRAGLELPPGIHVILLGSDEAASAGVPSWVAARAFRTDTIVIYPRRIPAFPYDSFESVVLHEIVHLSLTMRAAERPLPRWFHEGVAVSVEAGWGIGSRARLLFAAARDPQIEQVAELFRSGAEPETSTAYLLSAALVEDVRRRHGLAIPGAVAARVGEGESFDAAFRAETGETPDEAAARAWRAYRGLRWLPIVTSGGSLWLWILGLSFVAFVVRLRRRRQKRWEEEERDERLNAEG